MSRIGKKEIVIPKEITININKTCINIKGPKGELSYYVSDLINVIHENNTITLTRNHDSKKSRSIHGLSRSIIYNMVHGVYQGFEKKLIIEGVGYRSQNDGKNLILNVGYSHPITIIPPKDITIKVENNTSISILGINKETVGQIAAQIRSVRPPEPYKGKGIRYIEEIVKRKVGKAGK